MDTFIMAVILMAALVMGTETTQHDPDFKPADAATPQDPSVYGEAADSSCGHRDYRNRPRDLSSARPVQGNDSDH